MPGLWVISGGSMAQGRAVSRSDETSGVLESAVVKVKLQLCPERSWRLATVRAPQRADLLFIRKAEEGKFILGQFLLEVGNERAEQALIETPSSWSTRAPGERLDMLAKRFGP